MICELDRDRFPRAILKLHSHYIEILTPCRHFVQFGGLLVVRLETKEDMSSGRSRRKLNHNLVKIHQN